MKCIATCQFRGVTTKGEELDISGADLQLDIVKHNFVSIGSNEPPVNSIEPGKKAIPPTGGGEGGKGEGGKGNSNGTPVDIVKDAHNLTVAQLKEKLTAMGVKFDPNSRKENLLDFYIKAAQVIAKKSELNLSGEGGTEENPLNEGTGTNPKDGQGTGTQTAPGETGTDTKPPENENK